MCDLTNELVKAAEKEVLSEEETDRFLVEIKTVVNEYEMFKKQYYDRFYRWSVFSILLVVACNAVSIFATGIFKTIALILLTAICILYLIYAFRNHEEIVAKRFRKHQQKRKGREIVTSKRLFVESWVYYNDSLVKLTYEDGSEVFIDKAVFKREFQTVISNDKETVLRDFASDIQLISE